MTATAPGSAAPPDELVARFRAALERLWPHEKRRAELPLGLAVSGGPDSMAMLLLAHEVIPDEFEVATVDHGLRAEAKMECERVREICQERDIPCAILKINCAPGNLQQEARRARYKALDDWAHLRLIGIATAHHADDQAETLIMRLNRGSGLAGLAGMRPVSLLPGSVMTPLFRPLLGWRRSELARVVEAAGIETISDPSNEDATFDRVRIRKAMKDADWLDPAAIARSAALLQEAHEFIQAEVVRDWGDNITKEASVQRYHVRRAGVPQWRRPVVIGVVERILEQMGRSARGSEVARLVDGLLEGRQANLAGVLARCDAEDWLFEPEPERLN